MATESKRQERSRAFQRATQPVNDGVLTTRIADHLFAHQEGCRSVEIADRFALDAFEVRDELVEMEQLGIVFRIGRTRGTRWFLG